MNIEKFENKILTPLERWSPLGQKTDEYGANYIGHIFKDAPFGYLHVLYMRASTKSILAAEYEMGRVFPKKYKEFLLFSNGGSFYNPSGINIYGVLQDEYYPDIKEKPWRFPTDIIYANKRDWLSHLPATAVIIGKDEGVGTYLVSLHDDGPVVEFDANEPDHITSEWTDFDDWLVSELENLFIEHDDSGSPLEVGGEVH